MCFQVYTVSLNELGQYVPRDLLPRTLGGNQASVHSVWLQLCRQVASDMQPDMDAYFIAPKIPANSSRGSCSSMTHSYSSDTDPHISDLDSESSKDTVHEKHNHEDREKEKGDGEDVTSGKDKDDSSVTTTTKKRKSSATRRNSESRKRTSELAAFDDSQGDLQSEDLPRKKRPLSSGSNILDDSIHMPESSGLNINQLIEHVQTVKKKGLFGEYAHIRMEAHAGTFNHSR